MKKFLCLLTVLLCGCATEYKTVDVYGNEAYRIECSVGFEKVCWNKAAKVCPAGYHLIGKDLGGGFLDSRKNITVRCKGK